MQPQRRNEIALAYLKWLLTDPHRSLASLDATEASYSFFDGQGIERSELHSFLNARAMNDLGLCLEIEPEREREIAWAVVIFEAQRDPSILVVPTGADLVQMALATKIPADELATFIEQLRNMITLPI